MSRNIVNCQLSLKKCYTGGCGLPGGGGQVGWSGVYP